MDKQAKSCDLGLDNASRVAGETAGCEFRDARLGSLLQQLTDGIGRAVPLACQDRASTKAAYRFFDNDRVDEQTILAEHFQATRERVHALGGPVLVVHDTTEFSYMRTEPELVGLSGGSVRHNGQATTRKQCGVLMHSSLEQQEQGADARIDRRSRAGTRCSRKSGTARVEADHEPASRFRG